MGRLAQAVGRDNPEELDQRCRTVFLVVNAICVLGFAFLFLAVWLGGSRRDHCEVSARKPMARPAGLRWVLLDASAAILLPFKEAVKPTRSGSYPSARRVGLRQVLPGAAVVLLLPFMEAVRFIEATKSAPSGSHGANLYWADLIPWLVFIACVSLIAVRAESGGTIDAPPAPAGPPGIAPFTPTQNTITVR
jgi:hypothetical protein